MNMKLIFLSRNDQNRLGLQIEMLLTIAMKSTLKTMLCLFPGLFEITPFYFSGNSQKLFFGQSLIDGEDRFQFLDFKTDSFSGYQGCFLVFRGNHSNGLTNIMHSIFSKEWFIGNNIAEMIIPRKILKGEDA